MKANVCSVKYNPGSSLYVAVCLFFSLYTNIINTELQLSVCVFLIVPFNLWFLECPDQPFACTVWQILLSLILEHFQVGSADHNIHYYDLRNISQPLHVFNGHKKAVSYVKFLSNNELASASTDSTLRLWDVKENLPVSYLHDMLSIDIQNEVNLHENCAPCPPFFCHSLVFLANSHSRFANQSIKPCGNLLDLLNFFTKNTMWLLCLLELGILSFLWLRHRFFSLSS